MVSAINHLASILPQIVVKLSIILKYFSGAVKAVYKHEGTSDVVNRISEASEIKDLHNSRPKINGVGVYN